MSAGMSGLPLTEPLDIDYDIHQLPLGLSCTG